MLELQAERIVITGCTACTLDVVWMQRSVRSHVALVLLRLPPFKMALQLCPLLPSSHRSRG